ncbi:hypothetical protein HHI36_003480 [Cryptolaemus montrouzieri]|uniref:Uncharacterized protein n=1 Tax=Cryptolaemus montrouzieri TaxID=559131 RepID=A0ABD2PDY7_9CUCU
MLVRQLEEELRMRMRGPSIEMQQQMEALYQENEHLTREIAILRDTIKELELRIETQKQTLQARDESIKKLLEMLQNKGMGKEEERQMFQQMQAMAQKQELQAANETLRTLQTQLELVPSPSSSTVRVLLDTKDARIATLEREVNLLESEVRRLGGSIDPPPTLSLSQSEFPQAAPFKRQVSFLLNDVQIGKDGVILGRL